MLCTYLVSKISTFLPRQAGGKIEDDSDEYWLYIIIVINLIIKLSMYVHWLVSLVWKQSLQVVCTIIIHISLMAPLLSAHHVHADFVQGFMRSSSTISPRPFLDALTSTFLPRSSSTISWWPLADAICGALPKNPPCALTSAFLSLDGSK
jgi:hypothetical protein